ncbi:MAG: tape measure protein [Clostridia bacterium]|nr:tape measure protein [Clostridia bacterium]
MAKGNSVKIRIDGDASDLEKKLKNIGNTAKAGLADVKAGIDLATQAVKTFASVAEKGIGYNATIEQLKTSFEVMTGSAEKAVEVTERLRTMGAETPFEMKDLASTTQLLMQYGFTADEALDRMKMLGDVAQGNVNAMNSIALGYAQMASAGKVNLVDIKQMINGGFNPLQEISERTGESMASLYDRISKGKISVDEITESMRHATSEGGRFYQSMEKQSQTLNGQLSTLKDNADQLLGSLTQGVSDGLRDQLLPFANNLVAELQSAFDAGGYQGLVDTATDMIPDLLGMMAGELQKGIEGLSRWLPKGASQLMRALPSSLRRGATVTPQITQALFEVANQVIFDLVGMLPELVPIVVEGFAGLMTASLRGFEGMVDSVIGGMVQAIHHGQTMVAGTWVEDEQIAKFNFKIDTNLTDVKETIQDAYSEIRGALQTDLLTDAQKTEIESMIGDDYEDIKAKLMSFGLTESEAAPIAESVSGAGKVIKDAISQLDITVPGETVTKWFAQANGSRIALRASLKSAGLSESDISEITGLYDEMTGRVVDGTPNIMEEIYDKLTDGKPDDTQTVESLKSQIESYIGGLLTELETAYQAKLGELDVTASDYEEKKAVLDEWYNTTKASITEMDEGMRSLVTEMANAPTSIVQSKMAEFAEIERQLLGIEQEIDRLNEKARSAAENAFQVVRSGAKADAATIEQAVNLKYTEFKIDEQSAQDAYDAAVQQLNADLASGKISKEGEDGYDASIALREQELNGAKEAARTAYENALREIFGGIAEAEGVDEALREVAAKTDLSNALQSLSAELSTQFGSMELGDQLGEDFTAALAEHMGISPDVLKSKTIDEVRGALEGWSADLLSETQGALEGLDSTQLQAAYGKMLNDGVLGSTVFDSATAEGQLSALFSNMYTNAAASAAPSANAAGATLMDSAADGGANSKSTGKGLGGDFGSGYVSGIASWASKAYNAAYNIASQAAKGAAAGQNSASPSKVAIGLGHDFGEGYTIGLRDSMGRAAAVAKQLTGNIATSATLSQSMRVSMPTLTQDIVMANEQSDRSVNLYVNGKELGRVMAADNQTAQNRYNRTIAMGVGK